MGSICAQGGQLGVKKYKNVGLSGTNVTGPLLTSELFEEEQALATLTSANHRNCRRFIL